MMSLPVCTASQACASARATPAGRGTGADAGATGASKMLRVFCSVRCSNRQPKSLFGFHACCSPSSAPPFFLFSIAPVFLFFLCSLSQYDLSFLSCWPNSFSFFLSFGLSLSSLSLCPPSPPSTLLSPVFLIHTLSFSTYTVAGEAFCGRSAAG